MQDNYKKTINESNDFIKENLNKIVLEKLKKLTFKISLCLDLLNVDAVRCKVEHLLNELTLPQVAKAVGYQFKSIPFLNRGIIANLNIPGYGQVLRVHIQFRVYIVQPIGEINELSCLYVSHNNILLKWYFVFGTGCILSY